MWLKRPTITQINIVKGYLVDRRLEPAFYTSTRLSKLSRTQRDLVLVLAERIRKVAHLDTLTLKLPRLEYVQNIANYLIDNLGIDNETKTEKIRVIIERIPESVIERFVRSAAVNLQKKVLYFEKLSDVIKDNIEDMIKPSPH